MKTVYYTAKFDPNASRWELLVRLVYWIPLVIVLGLLGIIALASAFLQLVYILATARRSRTLFNLSKMAVGYRAKMESYYLLLTKERPEIIPNY